MTKKVTGKHLKKLIEGVLNEKFLPIDRKKTGSRPSYRDFATDFNNKFGFSLDSYKADEIEKLFNKDPQDELTAADFGLEFLSNNIEPATSAEEGRRNRIRARALGVAVQNNDADAEKLFKSYIDMNDAGVPTFIEAQNPTPDQIQAYKVRLTSVFEQAGTEAAALADRIIAAFDTGFKQTPVAAPELKDDETFSDVSISTAGATVSRGKKPEMSQSEKYIFTKFFANVGVDVAAAPNSPTDFISRIKAISNFSEAIANRTVLPSELAINEPVKFLNYVLMLEYFNKIIRESDAMGAAYDFEALCAFIGGGRKSGGESGTAGGQGEADFFLGDGSKGSAKYYAGKAISQSKANFQYDAPVFYVVGQKKQAGAQRGTTKAAGEADPSLIVEVDLHCFFVQRDRDVAFKATKIDGTDLEGLIIGDTSLKMNKLLKPDTVVATLVLVGQDKETLDSNLENLNTGIDSTFKEALEDLKKIVGSIKIAKDEVIGFSQDADINKGVKAMQELNASRDTLSNFSTKLDPNLSPINKEVRKEQKITTNLLKKLIEEKLKK